MSKPQLYLRLRKVTTINKQIIIRSLTTKSPEIRAFLYTSRKRDTGSWKKNSIAVVVGEGTDIINNLFFSRQTRNHKHYAQSNR